MEGIKLLTDVVLECCGMTELCEFPVTCAYYKPTLEEKKDHIQDSFKILKRRLIGNGAHVVIATLTDNQKEDWEKALLSTGFKKHMSWRNGKYHKGSRNRITLYIKTFGVVKKHYD
jgi:hypothetical protein